MQVGRELSEIFQVFGKKHHPTRIVCRAKLCFKREGEIKREKNKNEGIRYQHTCFVRKVKKNCQKVMIKKGRVLEEVK